MKCVLTVGNNIENINACCWWLVTRDILYYVYKSQEKIKIEFEFEFAMFIMLIFSDIFLNIISSRTGRLSLILKFKVKVNSPLRS